MKRTKILKFGCMDTEGAWKTSLVLYKPYTPKGLCIWGAGKDTKVQIEYSYNYISAFVKPVPASRFQVPFKPEDLEKAIEEGIATFNLPKAKLLKPGSLIEIEISGPAQHIRMWGDQKEVCICGKDLPHHLVMLSYPFTHTCSCGIQHKSDGKELNRIY